MCTSPKVVAASFAESSRRCLLDQQVVHPQVPHQGVSHIPVPGRGPPAHRVSHVQWHILSMTCHTYVSWRHRMPFWGMACGPRACPMSARRVGAHTRDWRRLDAHPRGHGHKPLAMAIGVALSLGMARVRRQSTIEVVRVRGGGAIRHIAAELCQNQASRRASPLVKPQL